MIQCSAPHLQTPSRPCGGAPLLKRPPHPWLLAAPLRLWTTYQDGEVLLRLSKHGPGHETPMTIPELFQESVQRFSAHPAVSSKTSKEWETLSFLQYYQGCRRAARALIKVSGWPGLPRPPA